MSNKLQRILRELYPGKEEYSPEEVSFAQRAILIAKKDAKRSRIPRTDIAIGDTFFRKGREYVCVRRPRVSLPSEACSGCSFNTSDVKCIGLRCSSFDRSDRNNVWFEEVER